MNAEIRAVMVPAELSAATGLYISRPMDSGTPKNVGTDRRKGRPENCYRLNSLYAGQASELVQPDCVALCLCVCLPNRSRKKKKIRIRWESGYLLNVDG